MTTTHRLPRDTAKLVHWYERYVSPVALVIGFLADNFFLTRRVDVWQTNLLLGSYLAIAAGGIGILNAVEEGRLRGERSLTLAPFIPIVVQFSFGGLFSGYLSLYSRSAAFPGSWIFVGIVAALLLGNERFTRFYTRVPFQISIYFIVLYSFLTFFLPVVFHSIGAAMFLAAGAVSLGAIALLLAALRRIAPSRMRRSLPGTARAIAAILAVFNVLYFANFIPPLPLSLKEAGVYHRVARLPDGSYRVLAEPVPWYESFLRYNTVFRLVPGDDIYVFSAVFAPARLSTTVVYEWQYDAAGTWTTVGTIPFVISGGRDGGYRSYSVLSHAAAGKWRVNVLTAEGRVIGRIPFTVELAANPPRLAAETK